MKAWDLHCDTLYAMRKLQAQGKEADFYRNDLHVDLEKLRKGDYLLQCMACFIDLGEDEADPLRVCLEMIDIFYDILEKYPDDLMQISSPQDIAALKKSGKIGAMLTVEEGGACLGDKRILRDLYRLGVRMMTLTWNYENPLAYPNVVPGDMSNTWPCAAVTDKGLKEKGLEILDEMERIRMIVDVAHLSDCGIWDVMRSAKRPFVSSHSNARGLCPHVRNLTDDMLRAMGDKGCLIGLNYCPSFLDANPDRSDLISRVSDMVRHAEHIIDLAGEDSLALGSDFDGIEGCLEIKGPQDVQLLAQALEKAGFSTERIEKIFYKNAMRFFSENL